MALSRNSYDLTANDSTTGLFRDGQAAGAIVPNRHRSMFTHTYQSMYMWEDTEPIATSGTDTYTASFSFNAGVFTNGRLLLIRFTNANTGAATLDINSATGAIPIKKNVSEALVAGDIAAGEIILLAWDQPNATFQIVGRRPNTGLQYIDVTIPTASVLTANSSPVELVPAGGAGTAIVIFDVIISIDYNSAAYATNVDVVIRRGTTAVISISGLLGGTADEVYHADAAGQDILTFNQNINFFVSTGNPTAGNSDIKVKVYYKVVTV